MRFYCNYCTFIGHLSHAMRKGMEKGVKGGKEKDVP